MSNLLTKGVCLALALSAAGAAQAVEKGVSLDIENYCTLSSNFNL